MKLDLVMPMAGAGVRFAAGGFVGPKPLLPLHGRPFFYWAVKSIDPTLVRSLRFVVLREHVERFALREAIEGFFPDAEIVVLDRVLPGAVLTCMEGVRTLAGDAPLLFNDCDHFFRCAGLAALPDGPTGPDGALLTFPAHEPLYSFAELDAAGRVLRTVEKQAVSDRAICGAYYFRNKAVFLTYAERYLKTCQYSEYFMSGVYNELIADGRDVLSLPTELHVSFGTPEEYARAAADAALARLCP